MLAYAPRNRASANPSALTIVIALHAAGLAALLLAKPELVLPAKAPPTVIDFIDPAPPEPAPPPPPAPPQPQVETVREMPTLIDPVIPIPVPGPSVTTDKVLDLSGPIDLGLEIAPPQIGEGPPAPARIEARLKTPAHRLRPDYPASKRRMGEEATLRLRLAIDEVGRVTSVTPIGSYDAVFLAAAERHILKHWRYEPASLGGEAIADTATVSLQFTLED